jgi:uncharacterized protein (DUF1330 family)
MPAYIVLNVTVRERETYDRYKKLAAQSVATYGGRYLARGGAIETLEGQWHPARFVILEFPTLERGRAWWMSPEYAPAKALRQSCADAEMVLVEGMAG